VLVFDAKETPEYAPTLEMTAQPSHSPMTQDEQDAWMREHDMRTEREHQRYESNAVRRLIRWKNDDDRDIDLWMRQIWIDFEWSDSLQSDLADSIDWAELWDVWSPKEQAVVERRLYHRLSLRAISEALGLSTGGVHLVWHRAMNKMQKYIVEKHPFLIEKWTNDDSMEGENELDHDNRENTETN
jgi:hypothetical protein